MEHAVKLNISDEIYERFMGLVDILPKDSVKVEEVDEIPYYPSISFEEAKQKVQNAVANISNNTGVEADEFFSELLS